MAIEYSCGLSNKKTAEIFLRCLQAPAIYSYGVRWRIIGGLMHKNGSFWHKVLGIGVATGFVGFGVGFGVGVEPGAGALVGQSSGS